MALLRECLGIVRAAHGVSGPPALGEPGKLSRLRGIRPHTETGLPYEQPAPGQERAAYSEHSQTAAPPTQTH
jgi:hypothetical protein